VIKISADPKEGVVSTGVVDRIIGRTVQIDLPSKPVDEGASDLAADTFFTLFQTDPMTREIIAPERAVNKSLVDWAMKSPSFGETHAATESNIAASVAASGLLWQGLISDDSVKDALKEQEKARKEEEKAQQETQKALDALQEGQEKQAEQHAQKAQQHSEAAAAIAEAAAGKIDKMSQSPFAQGMMAGAIKEAGQAAGDVNAVMAGWGIDPGSVGTQDVQEILSLAHDARFMRTLADMIGRAEQVAVSAINATRACRTSTVTEPALTKKIEKVFPGERLMLSPDAPPLIRIIKMHRLFTSGLMGWQPREEMKRRGAFVAIVDESGSMHGDPILAAKAIVMGIGYALLHDKSVVERRYEIYGFATSRDIKPVVTSEQDWKAHIEWAKYFISGGGTDFDDAIQTAIERLRKMKEQEIEGADCLFITDGWASVSDRTKAAWRKLKEETGAKMLTVSIGGGQNDEVREMSDEFIQIGSYADLQKDAEKIITQMTSAIIRAEDEQTGGD